MLPNPEHNVWLAADQLLVGWLYNSMTPEVAAQLMGYDEAKLLWDAIQEYIGIQSRSQEDYYRQMMQQTMKGSMKMEEYLVVMKKNTTITYYWQILLWILGVLFHMFSLALMRNITLLYVSLEVKTLHGTKFSMNYFLMSNLL